MASKLILPQDRYCKGNTYSEEKSETSNSKFNRYDDKSESESDSDEEEEEDTSSRKLERANSLEALMQELENEIEGKSDTPKVKVKKVKKKIEEEKPEDQPPTEDTPFVEQKPITEEKPKEQLATEKPPMEMQRVIKHQPPTKRTDFRTSHRNSVAPRLPYETAIQAPPPETVVPAYIPPQPSAYYAPPIPPQPVVIPPPYTGLPPMGYEPPLPRYDTRIPSPLTISTDLLNTTVST